MSKPLPGGNRHPDFSARDYNYYQIFAGMRYGLILSRIMLATGQDSEVQNNFACQLLQKYHGPDYLNSSPRSRRMSSAPVLD